MQKWRGFSDGVVKRVFTLVGEPHKKGPFQGQPNFHDLLAVSQDTDS